MRLVGVLVLICSSVIGFSQMSVLEDYEYGGPSVPTFLGKRPSRMFFEESLKPAVESRADYSMELDLSALKLNISSFTVGSYDLYITLINESKASNSIALSGELSGGRHKNYLVNVKPGMTLVLNANELLQYDMFFALAINDFSILIDINSFGRSFLVEENLADSPLPLIEPQYFTNYCSDILSKKLSVEHISGPFEDAWFNRSWRSNFAICSPNHTHDSQYEISVYWPNSSTLHHASNQAIWRCNQDGCEDSDDCIPNCQMYGYSTTSVTDGTGLLWRNVNFDALDPQGIIKEREKSFDEVLFNQACGIAFCRPINPGGKCLDEPSDWVWYVHEPGMSCQ